MGKVEAGIPEDDPRNPATIADNVGDNVGDVAGMGADLYESYIGSIIATMALGASAYSIYAKENIMVVLLSMLLPLSIASIGILCSIVGTFFVHVKGQATQKVLLGALRRGIYLSTVLTVVFSYFLVNHYPTAVLLKGKAEAELIISDSSLTPKIKIERLDSLARVYQTIPYLQAYFKYQQALILIHNQETEKALNILNDLVERYSQFKEK